MSNQKVRQQQTEYLSMVGHELKNPLAVIKSFAQLLRRRLVKHKDEVALQQLERIEAKTDELTQLVTVVSQTVKLQSGLLPLSQELIDLHQSLQSVCIDLHGEVLCKLVLQKTNSPLRIMADKRHLEYVLEILLRALFKRSMLEETTQNLPLSIETLQNEDDKMHVQVVFFAGTTRPQAIDTASQEAFDKDILLTYAVEYIHSIGGTLTGEFTQELYVCLKLPVSKY